MSGTVKRLFVLAAVGAVVVAALVATRNERIQSNAGGAMKQTRLTIPELALIAGTRAALGGGVALLFSDRLNRDQRKAVGLTLLLVGAVTTIPLGMLVLSRRR
jgi:hypothetical protein